jgi:S1-C subfamily serine protease
MNARLCAALAPANRNSQHMLCFVSLKGPGDKLFEPGDIVVRVNGQLALTFIEQEAVLDDNVGTPVTFELERGGKAIVVTLKPQDLHAINPHEVLQHQPP